jgi:hypothetical protein
MKKRIPLIAVPALALGLLATPVTMSNEAAGLTPVLKLNQACADDSCDFSPFAICPCDSGYNGTTAWCG